MADRVRERSAATKGQIIEAALATLRSEGFAGTSARAIARAGGFNQALIFYHFGSLNGLLLAALDHSSTLRMERYREAVAQAHSLEDMLDVAVRVYREDLEGGHMTVVSELIAGSMAHHELRPEIIARMEPWIAFTEEAVSKVLVGSPFEGALPTRQLAFALVAFYCGINLVSTLDPDRSEAEALFETARRLVPILAAILQVPPRSRRSV